MDIDLDIPPPPTRPPPTPPVINITQSSSAPPIPPHWLSATPPSLPLRKESLLGQHCQGHAMVSMFEQRFITHFKHPTSFPPACPSPPVSPLHPSPIQPSSPTQQQHWQDEQINKSISDCLVYILTKLM